uniref:IS1182 family transposase n=1 Tax=Jeotgalibacillus alimentarius TaxID=135826 RepID=UPI000596E72F|nr:IS1182 family transposase [Jeotgalibacillus alimentarius]
MFKNYNMNQIILPLDLAITLQENDIAFLVHDLVEQIPQEAFAPFIKRTGCPAYHPRMMMKIILCAYTQSVFSGRKIEALLKDSVRMMWLAQDYQPTYRTINRFRVHPDAEILLRECFVQFRCHLVEKQQIDAEAIFIDGTKIEANANKFTFVWRKSVEKYSQSLVDKSNQIYDELVQQSIIPAIEQESPEELSVSELSAVVEKLGEVVEDMTQKINASDDTAERKRIRSARKLPKQWYKQFQNFLLRKQKYEQDMITFGERNSYSKTDPDATFMRMKDDYMKNGQLKAGYNVQIATEGQYTLAYDIFPNPTDTRTFIPFLNQIKEHFFSLPSYIVADAGYGSEENYQYVFEDQATTPLITYNMHRKEQTKKYKKNEFNTANWHYDPLADAYTCPNGQRLTFRHHSHKTDRYGFTRKYKVYECESCDGCPLRASCTKAKEGNNRKISYNEHWEQQKELIRTLLSEAKTGEIYAKRKIDVEPVFGFLKANLGFTRFSVRGKERAKNEMGFALMAVNLRKLAASGTRIA